MNERKAIFLINVLKNIINVYFDTFFVMYFFQIANYEIVPLAKYYITLYMFIGIGFVFIRKSIKKNIIVPYLRLGISMQALYIALIMLLKENIINLILLLVVMIIPFSIYFIKHKLILTYKVMLFYLFFQYIIIIVVNYIAKLIKKLFKRKAC